jgi:uncharacterized membrane protein
MTNTVSTPGRSTDQFAGTTGVTAWVGWVIFAGTLMVLLGLFHGIQGFVALTYPNYYLVGPNGLTLQMDYTAWGWTHLIAGAVIVAAGIGLFVGQTWARAVGIVVAVLSALVNFVFIAAYPMWSLIIIAMDVFIVYALAVHGRELKTH